MALGGGSQIDFMGVGMPALLEYLRANRAFQQQAGGAPLTPINQQMLQQANQPEFDLLGALQQAEAQNPGPRRGFMENLAANLGSMNLPPATNFGDAFAQGLMGGFAGTVNRRQATAEEKAASRRKAASELAKARWERVNEEKDFAKKSLMSSAEKAMLEEGRNRRAENAQEAAMNRLLAGIEARGGRMETMLDNQTRRLALQEQQQARMAFDSVLDNMRMDKAMSQFVDVKAARNGARAAYLNPGSNIADITLMRLYAKISDPTTGVREEEYRTVESSAGALARLRRYPLKLQGKGSLTPRDRKLLMDRIESFYQSRKRNAEQAIPKHRNYAKRAGVPWSEVSAEWDTMDTSDEDILRWSDEFKGSVESKGNASSFLDEEGI